MRGEKMSKAINFIEYISKTIDKNEMYYLYKVNGIKYEKVELYYDFIYGLFDLVVNTHMGDDHMTEEDDEKHFEWCWNKTVQNFKRERIYFDTTRELYNYFFTLMQESFYSEEKTEENSNKLITFWQTCFDYKGPKTMSELEALIDIYKLFNKSLYTI
jgi:hypothetical protein